LSVLTSMHADDALLADAEPRPAKRPRLDFLDAAKGIGILAVMALHSSGRSSRTLLTQNSAEWWIDVGFNRLMAFAVPMFLCVSAFLWAFGAASKPGIAAGTIRRLSTILYPYLIWTALYLLWQAFVEGTPIANMSSGKALYNDLVWGKGYFHLYFLSVLLQAAILFPLMLWMARRTGFLACCAGSIIIQALVFVAQSKLHFLPFPGSSVLWYVTSLLPAAWLGAHWPVSPPSLRKLLMVSLTLGLPSTAAYLWLEVLDVDGLRRFGVLLNPVQQLFVFSAGLAVISWLALRKPVASKGWSWLCWIGASSLPFYLLHPMVMRFLSGPRITQVLQRIPIGPLWSYGALLAGTFVAVWVLNKIRAEKLLFGRSTPALPKNLDKA